MSEADQESQVNGVDLAACVPRETSYLLDCSEIVLSPLFSRRGSPLLLGDDEVVKCCMAKEIVLPKELCGFYVCKLGGGEWCFGRPKGSAIYWEKCELSDLLYLGIAADDLEGLVVGRSYRAACAPILLHPS